MKSSGRSRGESPEAERALRRAVDSHVAGDVSAAEAGYREAAQLGSVAGAFHLGEFLADRNRMEEAAEAYEQASLGGDIEAKLNLADIREGLGQVADSVRLYEEVIAAGDARGSVDLGALLERQDDLTNAEQHYLQALAAGEFRAHLRLGYLYADEHRDAEALEQLQYAVEHEVPGAQSAFGWMLRRLGRLEEAEEWLRSARDRGE